MSAGILNTGRSGFWTMPWIIISAIIMVATTLAFVMILARATPRSDPSANRTPGSSPFILPLKMLNGKANVPCGQCPACELERLLDVLVRKQEDDDDLTSDDEDDGDLTSDDEKNCVADNSDDESVDVHQRRAEELVKGIRQGHSLVSPNDSNLASASSDIGKRTTIQAATANLEPGTPCPSLADETPAGRRKIRTGQRTKSRNKGNGIPRHNLSVSFANSSSKRPAGPQIGKVEFVGVAGEEPEQYHYELKDYVWLTVRDALAMELNTSNTVESLAGLFASITSTRWKEALKEPNSEFFATLLPYEMPGSLGIAYFLDVKFWNGELAVKAKVFGQARPSECDEVLRETVVQHSKNMVRSAQKSMRRFAGRAE
ncbi:unnamed protein product [Cyclocybe aegerita]|uniref:Transmembrane protein n=1 Tax=Cyclocybe aegerita TaxID=1973307 RepID=A0A8S0WJD2_CYCAE|nr:unnamed protein product [Cyclocybe aegerita]